ncbi:MAG: FMN-binding negative transcriptional regulator [Comamonas sp.]|jgi:transcriptional regulator
MNTPVTNDAPVPPSTYMPKQFISDRLEDALAIMQSHPLATLTSVDAEGFPFITHLPLHVEKLEGNEGLVLWGHCSRANPHWKLLASKPQALVVFRGAHSYLSPSIYPDLQRVPTWNYVALHCRVQVDLVDDAEDKDALLKCLIGDHEPAYAAQWRGLDADYTRKMLAAVVGFRMRVQARECKLKVNQHRTESWDTQRDYYTVQAQQGDCNAKELLQWMDKLAAR